MSLDNLLKIKQLQVHKPSKEAMLRLLDAAKRNIADATFLQSVVKTVSMRPISASCNAPC